MASYGIRRYPPIPAQAEVADCPLTFQQERVLHFCELDPGSSIWDINTCKRLTGEVDAGSLQRALERLIEGHQVLRTRISRNDDGSSRQSFDQDTRDAFRGSRPSDYWIHELDPHPNASAHAIFAREIDAFLRAEGLIPR